MKAATPMRFLFLSILISLASSIGHSQPANWSTNLIHVTGVPSAVAGSTTGIRAVMIGPDNYIYLGGGTGAYRAQASCVAAAPTSTACWTAMSNGAPSAPGNSVGAYDWVNGKVLAVWGDFYCTGGTCNIQVGSWDPNTATWTMSGTGSFRQNASMPQWITHDASNNIYFGYGPVYKSTNGGATWTNPNGGTTDMLSAIGLTDGYVYDGAVWGGNFYWGGEGPGVKQSLSFGATYKNYFPTVNGGCPGGLPCFEHNYRGTVADGNNAAGASLELIALINDCTVANCGTGTNGLSYIQRYDIVHGTYADVGYLSVPGHTTTQYWTMRRLRQGKSAGEYCAVGGGSSDATSIMCSFDHGVTWSFPGNPTSVNMIPTTSNNGSAFAYLGISPVDDSKAMASETDMYFQPAIANVTPTSFGPYTVSQNIGTNSVTANNFNGTVTWSLLSGTPPAGMSGTCITGITGGTCTLSGTLTLAGAFSFTIRATDGTNTIDTPYSVTVNPASVSACDLNSDGSVNVVDVEIAVDVLLGSVQCPVAFTSAGACTLTTDKISTAAFGGACVAP